MPWKPHFFSSLSAWRAWLEKHHADSNEIWLGLYKLDSGRPSITWPEAVDGALCFGWIDGVRKSVDDISYKIRFTPRKPRSVWSAVNVRRATELSAAGLMHPAGLAAFEKRQGNRSEIYSYEQKTNAKLPAAYEKNFVPAKPLGISSKLRLRGIAELAIFGSSARRRKRLDSSGWPC
jgi:uncharacterized protein YdeI (YjbR/CyaY-like superfamily)